MPLTRAATAGPDDGRPLFRVAAFGLAERFRRLMSIVLNHARTNPYRYIVSEEGSPAGFDIALVDMTASGGPQIASALRNLPDVGVVVRVGRRDDLVRGRDDLLKPSFTMDLLSTLNRFVDERLSLRNPVIAHGAMNLVRGESDSPRRPRALLVDDSAVVRSNLALALQRFGMDSQGVGDAAAALQVMAERRFELVLVDVVMPGENGFSLTRSIKRDRLLRATPVVMLTGRSSPIDLARGALAGSDGYLVKPVAMHSLRDTVYRHVARRLREEEPGSAVARA